MSDLVELDESHRKQDAQEGRLRTVSGDWATAARALQEGLSNAAEPIARASFGCALAVLRAQQGHFAEAYELCSSALRTVETHGGPRDRAAALTALGAIHLEANSTAEALAALQEAARIADSDDAVEEAAYTFISLAEAHRRSGNAAGALVWIHEAEQRRVSRFWRAKATRVHAACLVDLGAPIEASEILRAVMAEPSTIDAYELGHCEEVLAAAVMALGERTEAAEHLATARSIFESLGAHHAARRCKPTGRRRGRPPLPRFAQLTPRELDVAVRVAEGLTDREVAQALGVSDRTVSKHVSNILRKIGAKRRTQIVRFVIHSNLRAPGRHAE